MSSVDLSDQEWGQLMNILSEVSWKIANPLLMKIGEQLRAQHQQPSIKQTGIKLDSNGQEVRHE